MDMFTSLLLSLNSKEKAPTTFSYTIDTRLCDTSYQLATCLPFPTASGNYYPADLIVDWGDGTSTTYLKGTATDNNNVHTYAEAGIYTITMTCLESVMPKFYSYGMGYNSYAGAVISINTPFMRMMVMNSPSGTPYDSQGHTGTSAYYQYYYGTFYNMKNLKFLPRKLLKWCPKFIGFFEFCGQCNVLENIGDSFFSLVATADNITSLNATYALNECRKLKFTDDMFYDTGVTDRFNGFNSITFTYAFYRTSWTGSEQGKAPDLWNQTGITTVYSSSAFAGSGNSVSSLSNYANITSAWGGPA